MDVKVQGLRFGVLAYDVRDLNPAPALGGGAGVSGVGLRGSSGSLGSIV